MPVEQIQLFCSQCRRNTLHSKPVFSEAVGCVLTVLTLGLFLPVWLVIAIAGWYRPFRCQFCGSTR